MAVTIDGTTGVSLVQDGVITGANLPAGSLLQLVQNLTTTDTTVNSTGYTDTTLTATITPSSTSSKILVIVSQSALIDIDTSIGQTKIKLFRGTTELEEYEYAPFIEVSGASTVKSNVYTNIQYLDSPSTTSATTYKTQGRPNTFNNNGRSRFQVGGTAAPSYMTLMEIAG